MKYVVIYTLSLLAVFHTSCGQRQTNVAKDNSKSETTVVIPSAGLDEKYHTKEEYSDSIGKRLIILNSVRKGGPYTDPKGIAYGKVIFWTRLINETDNSLELNIDLRVDSVEVPGLPGKYYRLLIPPDTMKIDKEPLYDYGMTGLKSFLDNNIHKPSSLKRTINPKESSGFYVIILFEHWVEAPFRAGLSIKGQNLFYSISRAGKEQPPVISDREILCGSINLRTLMLQK